jgi:hypothetical protein
LYEWVVQIAASVDVIICTICSYKVDFAIDIILCILWITNLNSEPVRLKTPFSATPKPGTTRTTRKFAWLPVAVAGNYVWLERYETLEGYIQFQYTVVVNDKTVVASVYKWIELSKRLRT